MTFRLPVIPRPGDFIGADGKLSTMGYSYLAEIERVTRQVNELLGTVESGLASNVSETARIAGLIKPGTGKLYQRRDVITLGTRSGLIGAGSELTLFSDTMSLNNQDSAAWIHAGVEHDSGAGSSLDDGFKVHLYVDGVLKETRTGFQVVSAVLWKQCAFVYRPTNTEPHQYEIRVVDTPNNYRVNANSYMYLEEIGV